MRGGGGGGGWGNLLFGDICGPGGQAGISIMSAPWSRQHHQSRREGWGGAGGGEKQAEKVIKNEASDRQRH